MQSRFDSIAAAKVWDGAKIPPNQEALILIHGIWTHWRFAVGSTSVDPFEYVVFAPTTNPSAGKWHYAGNKISFRMPWAFDTVEGTVLFTVPEGFRFYITHSRICEVLTDLILADGGYVGIGTNRTSFVPGVLGFGTFDGGYAAGSFIGVDDGDLYEPERSILLPGDTFIHQEVSGPGMFASGTAVWLVSCALLQL